jgi:hypothetical protein
MTCSLLMMMLCVTACGGSGGDGAAAGGTVPIPSGLAATFTPAQSSPGPDTVALAGGTTSGDEITVMVNVTNTDTIYGAAFELLYDPSLVTFRRHRAGSLLEQGGHTPFYQASTPVAGRLVVAATRQGNVPAVNVTGTDPLIELTFRMNTAGVSDLSFIPSAALFDDNIQPQPLPSLSWYGGSLAGN